MKSLQNAMAFIAVAVFALSFPTAYADTVSELSISRDGLFTGKNLSIIQKSGSNLAVRAIWGQAFLRMTILMSASTTVVKNHGETMDRSGVMEGDTIDVSGALATGANSIIVNADAIRDVSQERESQTLKGVVKSINSSELSFILPNQFGDTKVVLSASTPIQKGARAIEFSDLQTGDTILSVSGTYDYTTNTLTAFKVEVYQDKTMFAPKNFQGTLKTITATTLPTVLTLTVDGTDYTVYLASGSSVMRKNRGTTSLVRFAAGDTLRLYGNIRETNFEEIDASVVRDLNF